MSLSADGAVVTADAGSVRLSLAGGAAIVEPRAANPQPGVSNDLIGDDPSAWAAVPRYGAVRYDGVYSGIDLGFHAAGDSVRIEYDSEVPPGADPGAVRLRFDGAGRPS